MQRTWGQYCPPSLCLEFVSREVQAVEGKKPAESWGATFMLNESGLGWKIRKMVGVAVCFFVALLGVGDGGGVEYSPQSWMVLLAVN